MSPTMRNAALLLAASATAAIGYAAVPKSKPTPARPAQCSGEAGITLPPGFCATVFAEGVGHARHLVVAGDGTVYVNSWWRRAEAGVTPNKDGIVTGLRDSDGDGRADMVEHFGPLGPDGIGGGTGIALYKDGLYVDRGESIVRYPMAKGRIAPTGEAVTILSGMPITGDHPTHPFVIDPKGQIFVNMGSATNSCQGANRQPAVKGLDPCHELETRAGIWLYSADKTGQRFSPAERHATGIRNTGGMSFDAAGRMFAVQHGRDQLGQNWAPLYTAKQGEELPSEELLLVRKDGDYGWPFCYYDGVQKKLVLAPEYGGDGGKAVGRCASKLPPVAAFPAHWAPNDVLVYTGTQFPAAYRGGAFIAFHGSWNRAPGPQDGYVVMFQPLKDGRVSGAPIFFADGFAGGFKEPGRAAHRPAGLAIGPDGALYIADDQGGRIWRVTYKGSAAAPLVSAPRAKVAGAAAAPAPTTGRALPPGFTAAQVDLGRRIYLGQARGGTCTGCHGSDGRGTPAGPALTGPQWLWGDGSVPSIARVITNGVAKPRKFPGVMPPKGGAPLKPAEVQAVAAYVWTIGHAK